ncbi:hypothetical protein EVG20_g7152 [Dentipellis fragilis]|uniref:Amidase domain-containing protein n=1 Tax=Dentipellis fragilis TaxID=205917 RepID=A0A4Y9YJR7_9AGAM|nr:hypothetical protein EVG20_g7152 [Dentipellis fragilis]
MWPFSTSASVKEVVSAKRAERDAKVALAPPFSMDEHQEFLDATAVEIVRRISNGEWTASRVLDAYIARAAQAHAETNCLTEILFEQARGDAKLLDEEFAASGNLKGPLHGVPVSLKDQLNVAGVDTTIGFTQWAHDPATTDASVVQQLRAAGAIPIVKTNVPQTMLAFECSNPLWGRTTNPYSAAHTCGGSSGGEAALLAMDAWFGRVADDGARDPAPGFEAVRSVIGPMARSVEDVEAMAKVFFGARSTNYFPAPIPYRPIELPKKLKFGYYIRDDFVKSSPACQRAVLETVEALRREGHECVEFVPPNVLRAIELFVGLTSADSYETLLSHLGPDPKVSMNPTHAASGVQTSTEIVCAGIKFILDDFGSLTPWYSIPPLPVTSISDLQAAFIREFGRWIIQTFVGDDIFAKLFVHSRAKSVKEVYEYVEQRREFVSSWTEEVWAKNEFDAIIAPTQASPALPHGGCYNLSPLATATILYNIIDSPVGIVPVTRVDPERDQLSDEWRARAGEGSKILEKELYGNGIYDPVKMKGLPVGVQIVGRPWEEEKVIALMHEVDKALGPRGFGPGSWKP